MVAATGWSLETIPIANAIRRMNGIGRLAVGANRPVQRMK